MSSSPDRSQDSFFYLIKTTLRHSAVYGLFDFIGKATQLILVPLYTHVMTPEDYGLLEILLASTPLILTTLLLGFNSSIVRYYTTADSPRDGEAYFRTAFTTVFAFSAVVWAALFITAPALSRFTFGDTARADLWRLLVSAVALDAVGTIFLALFRSQGRPYRYSWVNLARFVSILALNVVFVGVMRLGTKGVLLGNLIGSGLGAIIGLMLCLREIGFEVDGKRLRKLAAYGLPLVVSGVGLSFVMSNADRYFLKASGSLHDIGIYSLGYRVGMVMSMLLNAFVVAWPPMMFRILKDPDAPRIYSRVLTYYVLVTGFVWVLVSSFSNEIVRLVAAPDFQAAGDVVWLILLSYLMQGVFYIMMVGVTVTDRTGWIPLVVGISAISNLVANALLIPRYGMQGAAWATFVSYTFLALLMRSVSRRYYPILMERRRVVLVAVLSCAIVGINRAGIGHANLMDATLKVIPIALFAPALLAARFFDDEEMLRFRHLLARVRARSR